MISEAQEQSLVQNVTCTAEAIGPHVQSQAQIINYASNKLSKEWQNRNHIRIKSTESCVSVGRRAIGKWAFDNNKSSTVDASVADNEISARHFKASHMPGNFRDHIAHITNSCVFLPNREGDITFEKWRFHDLKEKRIVLKNLFNLEKKIQASLMDIDTLTMEVKKLDNVMQEYIQKKQSMELVITALIYQSRTHKIRISEAEEVAASLPSFSHDSNLKKSNMNSSLNSFGSRTALSFKMNK